MTEIMRNSKVKQMTSEELHRMQLLMKELLCEVDRICIKHNIAYAVEGGTLLGAVRHGGFIPWDDDVDIAMIRSEYDKFCRICRTELDLSKYFLQTHETDPYYRWGYAKLLLNGTSYIRYGQEHVRAKTGIYVEIMPMDGIPNRPFVKFWFNLIRICCRKIMWSEIGKLRSANIVKRCFFKLLNQIPVGFAFRIFRYLSEKFNEQNCKWVTCLSLRDYWISGEKGYKKEYYIKTKRIPFEDITVNAPVKDVELLNKLYGSSYMQLPPEEERESHIPAADFNF